MKWLEIIIRKHKGRITQSLIVATMCLDSLAVFMPQKAVFYLLLAQLSLMIAYYLDLGD